MKKKSQLTLSSWSLSVSHCKETRREAKLKMRSNMSHPCVIISRSVFNFNTCKSHDLIYICKWHISSGFYRQTYHILIFSVWVSSDHFISRHNHQNVKQSTFLVCSRALVNTEMYVKLRRSWNLKTLTTTRIIIPWCLFLLEAGKEKWQEEEGNFVMEGGKSG